MFFDEKWMAPFWPAPVVATAGVVSRRSVEQRQDELLDEALKETFPASDPVSVFRIS